jgi:penicillin-binding protein 1A
MKKKILYIVLCLILLSVITVAGVFTVLYVQVSRETKERIQRGVIENIIFSESPVYYDDAETVMGVFFEKTHRRYIRYEKIPPQFIKALVAAEDKGFFTHPGFDIKAIARAMIANLQEGRIAQGGSTITQQTAKNIFKREKKSYKAKIKELMQALLLEKEYSKEEILEMYANQFFVSGVGRGLRIAAQYFFDEEAEDLDLVESAFIAGSVKSPNRYNPFTKKTEAEREEAKRLANVRKNYVLGNMLSLHFITQEEYDKAKTTEIPFKQGKMAYTLNVILDYIREQLESDYFKEILQEQGIENIATSGIKIYTSVNREMQEGALRSIRTHLPLLDVKLSGYGGEGANRRYLEMPEEAAERSKSELPFLSRITEIHSEKENPYLVVSWDDGGGIIDYEGLKPIGEAWLKGRLGNWAVFDKRHVRDFLKNLQVGQPVPVQSVLVAGEKRLVLSEIPELEGGIIVVNKGMIKAMVGGFFDRFFNRATDAKRQLGSIFKPLVYTAALQLKWNTVDPLMNVPDLYSYQKTQYIPRPDHTPEAPRVSLAWAGVKSENMATVWLLYHLTDHLNTSEFRKLMEILDLDRKKDESYEAYVTRIRDKYGVTVDRDVLMEAAFEEAKKDIESDLIFSGHESAIDTLRRLHFNIDPEQLDLQNPEEFQIARLSFSRLQNLHADMRGKIRMIKETLDPLAIAKDPAREALLRSLLSSFYLENQQNGESHLVYTEQAWPNLEPVLPEQIPDFLLRLEREDIWVDGLIPSKSIDLLQSNMRKDFERLMGQKRYDPEVLAKVGDFRRLVNTLYIVRLCKELGFSTKLDPVLSFPLGANAVSILEAALAYEAVMTGKVYPLADEISNAMVPIITKIVDRQGKTLWEYTPNPKKVLSPRVSKLVTNILRLVMENGTGRSARNAVHLSLETGDMEVDVPLPSFGKTGTANRFTNSSFVGFIPGPDDQSGRLELDEGYVIASYVGFDDNRPMKGKQISIYGASGALPLWIDTANSIVNCAQFKVNLGIADLAFEPQRLVETQDPGLRYVPVSPKSGFPIMEKGGTAPDDAPAVLTDADSPDQTLILRRVFEPIRESYDEQAATN